MAHETRGYAHRVDIRAGIDDVWQALVDPARMARWYGPQARVDAREGGSYWIRIDAELTREAHIDVYQPPRRLRLIYMPQPGLPASDAVMVDDFLLHSESAPPGKSGQLTILRLLGSGIPEGTAWDPWYLRLRGGWERGLLRLKVLLEPSQSPKKSPGQKPLTEPKK
jgi:uncharacterized protein YndB with AHSA1/START domain